MSDNDRVTYKGTNFFFVFGSIGLAAVIIKFLSYDQLSSDPTANTLILIPLSLLFLYSIYQLFKSSPELTYTDKGFAYKPLIKIIGADFVAWEQVKFFEYAHPEILDRNRQIKVVFDHEGKERIIHIPCLILKGSIKQIWGEGFIRWMSVTQPNITEERKKRALAAIGGK